MYVGVCVRVCMCVCVYAREHRRINCYCQHIHHKKKESFLRIHEIFYKLTAKKESILTRNSLRQILLYKRNIHVWVTIVIL